MGAGQTDTLKVKIHQKKIIGKWWNMDYYRDKALQMAPFMGPGPPSKSH
jgi:hypothetical protein